MAASDRASDLASGNVGHDLHMPPVAQADQASVARFDMQLSGIWRQVAGDMAAAAHGAVFARRTGDAITLVRVLNMCYLTADAFCLSPGNVPGEHYCVEEYQFTVAAGGTLADIPPEAIRSALQAGCGVDDGSAEGQALAICEAGDPVRDACCEAGDPVRDA